jgi:hypothetical protein
MGRFICKVTDPQDNKDYYLEWSTVVDAPVTWGMTLEKFEEYYREEYGRRSMDFEFIERMDRVEKKGTSSRLDDSFDDVISCNRAGKNDTNLTKEQIIDAYCRNNYEGDDRPLGEVDVNDT